MQYSGQYDGGIPRPTQEGGSLFINGFPSGPKPYEEVLTFLRKGSLLHKYGRHGTPKYHHFRLSSDDSELQWESKNGRIRRIPISWIHKWQKGQETSIFRKHPQPHRAHLSFSVVYTDQNRSERTLDVICNNGGEFELWYWGMQIVKHYPPYQWNAYIQARADELRRSTNSVPAYDSTPKSYDDARSLKHTPKGPGGAQAVGRMSYHSTGFTKQRELGDLYIWGSLAHLGEDSELQQQLLGRAPANPGIAPPDPMLSWQQSSVPILVNNTSSVDVVKASCGSRHAALITRAGELYTWGYGKAGNLGQGSQVSLSSPRQVARMRGKGITSVACSEGCTAAISSDGRLYTWGSGSAGQLGHGHTYAMPEPKLVLGPFADEVKIDQVSCGPYHTAAITSDGILYTWGNGLFGKLGHGNSTSAYLPRRVDALMDYVVLGVSCGWWHSAAVAAPRQRRSRSADSFGPQGPHCSTASPLGPGPPARAAHYAHAADDTAPLLAAELSHSPQLVGRRRTGALSARSVDSVPASMLGGGFEADTAALLTGSGYGAGVQAGTAAPMLTTAQEGQEAGLPAVSRPPPLAIVGVSREGMGSVYATTPSPLPSDTEGEWRDPSRGGMLFTWGGHFTWREPRGPQRAAAGKAASNVVVAPAQAQGKRDHHRGALGTGDVEGRLLPTRVHGDLDGRDVVQVACGWNLTVALTREGRVVQCGTTGAYNADERPCPWEGCRTPSLVGGALSGLFIEEVAVGMNHVAVVASKPHHPSGQISPADRRVRMLTWGRGASGQLGIALPHEQQKDFSTPQIVTAIDGRRVTHIACGGHHTLAVCEHDPRQTRRSGAASHSGQGGGGALLSSPLPAVSAVSGVATGLLYSGGQLISHTLLHNSLLQSLQSQSTSTSLSTGPQGRRRDARYETRDSQALSENGQAGKPRRESQARLVSIPTLSPGSNPDARRLGLHKSSSAGAVVGKQLSEAAVAAAAVDVASGGHHHSTGNTVHHSPGAHLTGSSSSAARCVAGSDGSGNAASRMSSRTGPAEPLIVGGHSLWGATTDNASSFSSPRNKDDEASVSATSSFSGLELVEPAGRQSHASASTSNTAGTTGGDPGVALPSPHGLPPPVPRRQHHEPPWAVAGGRSMPVDGRGGLEQVQEEYYDMRSTESGASPYATPSASPARRSLQPAEQDAGPTAGSSRGDALSSGGSASTSGVGYLLSARHAASAYPGAGLPAPPSTPAVANGPPFAPQAPLSRPREASMSAWVQQGALAAPAPGGQAAAPPVLCALPGPAEAAPSLQGGPAFAGPLRPSAQQSSGLTLAPSLGREVSFRAIAGAASTPHFDFSVPAASFAAAIVSATSGNSSPLAPRSRNTRQSMEGPGPALSAGGMNPNLSAPWRPASSNSEDADDAEVERLRLENQSLIDQVAALQRRLEVMAATHPHLPSPSIASTGTNGLITGTIGSISGAGTPLVPASPPTYAGLVAGGPGAENVGLISAATAALQRQRHRRAISMDAGRGCEVLANFRPGAGLKMPSVAASPGAHTSGWVPAAPVDPLGVPFPAVPNELAASIGSTAGVLPCSSSLPVPASTPPAATGAASVAVPQRTWVEEPGPGVYLWLQESLGGGGVVELVKIRFSKKGFTETEAHRWWESNKAWVNDKYLVNLTAERASSLSAAGTGGPPSGPAVLPGMSQNSRLIGGPGGVSAGGASHSTAGHWRQASTGAQHSNSNSSRLQEEGAGAHWTSYYDLQEFSNVAPGPGGGNVGEHHRMPSGGSSGGHHRRVPSAGRVM